MTLRSADAGVLTPWRALLYGAWAVGGIDFVYATVFVVLRGRPWTRAWQGVASAVLGPDSFTGGYASALLGVALHFAVATCIVGVYLTASRFVPLLRQKTLLCGLAFGLIAFFVMNLVVVPMTRIGRQPLVWSAFNVGGLLVHIFLLGPICAYFAGRAAWRGGPTT
jgi:Na+/alanine symporter